MKTWFDLEPLLDKIDTFDKATLESFANIMPPPSQNAAFHHKFDHAKQLILRRLQQINDAEIALQNSSNNTSDDHWSVLVEHISLCACLYGDRAELAQKRARFYVMPIKN